MHFFILLFWRMKPGFSAPGSWGFMGAFPRTFQNPQCVLYQSTPFVFSKFTVGVFFEIPPWGISKHTFFRGWFFETPHGFFQIKGKLKVPRSFLQIHNWVGLFWETHFWCRLLVVVFFLVSSFTNFGGHPPRFFLTKFKAVLETWFSHNDVKCWNAK